jgi:hypothetical protein
MFNNEEKFQEFKDLMIDNDGVISGSFLIQCILGEYWQDSDIDIFYNRCEPNKMRDDVSFWYHEDSYGSKYFTKNQLNIDKERECNNYLAPLEKIFYDEGDFYNYNDMMAFNPFYTEYMSVSNTKEYSLSTVKSFMINKIKVQTLEVMYHNPYGYGNGRGKYAEKNIKDFLKETVDFSICNNYYKWNNDGNPVFNFENMDGILTKTFKFKNNHRYHTEARFEKYRDRGFTIL